MALRAITFVVIIVADVSVRSYETDRPSFVQPMVRALHALADAGNIPLLGVSNTPFHEAVACFGHGHPLNSVLRRWGGSSLKTFVKTPFSACPPATGDAVLSRCLPPFELAPSTPFFHDSSLWIRL